MPQINDLAGVGEAMETDQQTRTWAMLMHLSILLGFVSGGLGVIAPWVIWLIKKEELPGIQPHGKVILNALLSALIYGVAGGIVATLFVVLTAGIGSLLLIPLGILIAGVSLALPIIGGIKASNGVLWHYPLSIRFVS